MYAANYGPPPAPVAPTVNFSSPAPGSAINYGDLLSVALQASDDEHVKTQSLSVTAGEKAVVKRRNRMHDVATQIKEV